MQVDKTVGYSSFLQHYSSYNIPLAGEGQQASSTGTSLDAQTQKAQESVVPAVQTSDIPAQISTQRRDASIRDVQTSLGNKDASLQGYSVSSLMTQDMKKAISDMQKDQVLQEYQYYVGSSRNNGSQILTQDEDGTVVRL
ncbi:MAG: hypothetical protein LKF52_00675 [Butyrivibrio sp.]|jgi:hypothetical protein|nr:hypothetical protein [Butyrivibrio sp.]